MIALPEGGIGGSVDSGYDGSDLQMDHSIPSKALIRCYKSGLYYEKEQMTQRSDGEWVHRDLLDYDPVTGRWE